MHFTCNWVDLGWFKTSKNILFKSSVKAMQIWPRNKWRKCCSLKLNRCLDRSCIYRDLMLKLDKSSTEAVSVENYEIRLFRYDYMHILEYLCRVSFLITLDIYKDHFKSRHKGDGRCWKQNTHILWLKKEIVLVHHSLYRSYCIFAQRVLWLRSFLIFIVDELKNFATNIFLKLVC